MTHNKFFILAAAAVLSAASVSCSKDDGNNDNGNSSALKVEYDSHAVDLGLPSGLKWSDQNLGADKPEDYGDYYAWGSVEPLSSFDSENYNADVDVENIPANFSGIAKYDAVVHSIGGRWRTPTYGEISELRSNTTQEWTTVNGVKGLKLTGKNGKSIFIPAAGFYSGENLSKDGFSGYLWSSSTDPGYTGVGISGVVNAGGVGGGGAYGYLGYSIRPVRGDLTTPEK